MLRFFFRDCWNFKVFLFQLPSLPALLSPYGFCQATPMLAHHWGLVEQDGLRWLLEGLSSLTTVVSYIMFIDGMWHKRNVII